MVEGSLAPSSRDPVSDALLPERFVFVSQETGNQIAVLPAGRHEAACCPRCGALFVLGSNLSADHLQSITDEDLDAFACLACGIEIPPASATCPACGWSYREEAS